MDIERWTSSDVRTARSGFQVDGGYGLPLVSSKRQDYDVRQTATLMEPGHQTISTTKADARIHVRLPQELKRTIEEAAAALGQSVSEFAISTVVREARQILQEAQATRLSNRDRDRFLAVLEAVDTPPNSALKTAARRYRERHA